MNAPVPDMSCDWVDHFMVESFGTMLLELNSTTYASNVRQADLPEHMHGLLYVYQYYWLRARHPSYLIYQYNAWVESSFWLPEYTWHYQYLMPSRVCHTGHVLSDLFLLFQVHNQARIITNGHLLDNAVSLPPKREHGIWSQQPLLQENSNLRKG